MEDILKDHGIKPSVIQDKIKEKKDKKGKSFNNHKTACKAIGINRKSIYKIYIPKIRNNISNIKRLWIGDLITDIYLVIIKSDYTIGRDKLYKTMINNGYKISSYVFRIHFEVIEYKSSSYIRKGNNQPKEDKYSGVWVPDFLDGKFR